MAAPSGAHGQFYNPNPPAFAAPRSPSPSQTAHRRGYQACDPCRKRKVKCDLGSVDDPRPPPCVRCRREQKKCEFSVTRRKRKDSNDGDEGSSDGGPRRDKRRLTSEGSYGEQANIPDYQFDSSDTYAMSSTSPRQWQDMAPALNPNLHTGSATAYGTSLTTVKPHSAASFSTAPRGVSDQYSRQKDQILSNKASVNLFSQPISSSHDALYMLSEAAGKSEDINRANQKSPSTVFDSPSTAGPRIPSSDGMNGRISRQGALPHVDNKDLNPGLVDPQITGDSAPDLMPNLHDVEVQKALKVWARLRFVRAGWFTNREAMAYIAYYYQYLEPMTPVSIPDFRNPDTHLILLTEEPLLTVTLLSISSRHMKLSGPGAESRAYSIHERLWSHLKGMIERLQWGQEQFGGGFSGGGAVTLNDINPTGGRYSWIGSLRSLGTVEALLQLTEWHPRALHFPPGDDDNKLIDDLRANRDQEADPAGVLQQEKSQFAISSWLEPAWRSDRMCWMLLGSAQALAFELGVFDEKQIIRQERASEPERARQRRVRRLLLIYISQNSGRLGITSMLPLERWKDEDDRPPSLETAHLTKGALLVDTMQHCWLEIAGIMSRLNQKLFLTKEMTRELIKRNVYRAEIDAIMPQMLAFKEKFLKTPVSPLMRHVIHIEYEYTRMYVMSLALQAVVDQWTQISNDQAPAHPPQVVPGQFDQLIALYKPNEKYIHEVGDAARSILRNVLDGLVPGNYLRHAPVRTYLRILSAMIFLLKRFAFGATEDEARESLELLDRTVQCLKVCVVDDVHISNTISTTLQSLVLSIRRSFLRFSSTTNVPESDSRERTPQRSRQETPHHTEQQAHDQNQRTQGTAPAQPFGYNFDHNQATYQDPLAGIPAQPINPNLGISYMPPPPSMYPYFSNGGMGNADTANGFDESNAPDWFALPLDTFFNTSAETAVDQGFGGLGPMVGDSDMLDMILDGQYDNMVNQGMQQGHGQYPAI